MIQCFTVVFFVKSHWNFRTEIIVWFVDIGLTAELRYNGSSGERKRLDQGWQTSSGKECCLLPPANEVWGKVIFLHLFVILFTGGSTWPGTPPWTRYTPLDQVHPAQSMLGDTVNVRAVRILLECILVQSTFTNSIITTNLPQRLHQLKQLFSIPSFLIANIYWHYYYRCMLLTVLTNITDIYYRSTASDCSSIQLVKSNAKCTTECSEIIWSLKLSI